MARKLTSEVAEILCNETLPDANYWMEAPSPV